MSHNLVLYPTCGIACIVLVLAISGCAPAVPATPAAPAATVPLAEQMRQPWEPAEPVFVREFLVAGPFDEPTPHAAPPKGQPPDVRPAEFRDYLPAAGGEANVRPRAGDSVTGPDSRRVAWRPFTSKANLVNLAEAMSEAKDRSAVAYAYLTVPRERAGKVVLALWTRAYLTIYLNGRVVVDPNDHDALVDGAYVPVEMQAGDNAILIRVAGVTSRWPFSLRVVDESQLPAGDPALLRAAIVPDDDPSVLAVSVGNENAYAPDTLAVEVLGPAGLTPSRQIVPRGRTHRFNTAAWPEGPYEIRVMSTTPDGKPLTTYLPWYKGDWRGEVAAVLAAVERLPRDSDDPAVLRKLLARELLLARLAGASPAEAALSEYDFGRVVSALLEYREADALSRGRPSAGCFYRLAWRDEVDDSPQYARLYLPLDYDPARRYPLVVNLHGRSSINPPYAEKDQGDRHEPLAEQYDVIWLAPHGRGNSGYYGFGEADVMRAVAEAKKHFAIDNDRVYLTGSSMGGGGAWHVGTRHTDIFAAIAPIYGGWDYRSEFTPEEIASWPPQRLALMEADSSFAQAENLLHTPVFVNVGDQDSPGLIASLRYGVRMLQRWGYDVRYWEHPGKGHANLGCHDEIVEWFLAHSLVRAPRHVRLRSADLSGANAHWVHAEQQEDPFAFMLVDASIGRGNVIRVDSLNVLQLRLTPLPELLGAAGPVKVVWNGRLAYEGVLPDDGAITLRAEGYAPGPRVKKPMGPRPFALVVGTTSTDKRMARICRLLAERARQYWLGWQHIEPRVFLDTEMTDEQIRKYTLILFGGPAENAVTARLIKDIPLTLARDGITIDGKTFAVRDAAVRLVYPHPLNDDRLVAILAGNSADGMFHADLLGEEGDFGITDGRLAGDDDTLRCVVAWGRFDHNWRLNDKYLAAGDPSARAAAPVRRVPQRISPAVRGRRLPLSDLLEVSSCGSYARLCRGCNWQGRAIALGKRTYADGLAVQAWREPCKATWDLAGGNWKRLRATIGIEPDYQAAEQDRDLRERTRITFVVRGDGKELYTSPPFTFDSAPVELNVDVAGVQKLELETYNEAQRDAATVSINWADARLAK